MSGTLASTPALWYLTRGSGVVTLVLLTGTVVLGITTSSRWASPQWPRFVTEGLHRNLSLLVLVFLALHVTATVVDGYVPIRWLDAVVPFGSAYRPAWLGLGALALDLLVAVAITSLLRARLGYRTWRMAHWLAYACWPVALLHGLGIGSDTRQAWMLVIDAIAVGSAAAALWWRLAMARPARGRAQPGKGGATA
jgi:sulfoxide reductase heme-binding subunit YedZ